MFLAYGGNLNSLFCTNHFGWMPTLSSFTKNYTHPQKSLSSKRELCFHFKILYRIRFNPFENKIKKGLKNPNSLRLTPCIIRHFDQDTHNKNKSLGAYVRPAFTCVLPPVAISARATTYISCTYVVFVLMRKHTQTTHMAKTQACIHLVFFSSRDDIYIYYRGGYIYNFYCRV